MSIAGWIIAGLAAALCATIAALSAEKGRREQEKEKIRQEAAENARHTADIITEANQIKSDANTGNHSDDLHIMAEQLHDYADGS